MSLPAERLDLIIQKGAKFYQEFQQVQDDMTPISLVGKTLKCTIKESYNSATVVHELTEENGGIVKIDAINGVFAMDISANQTNVSICVGVYDIVLIDPLYPTIEIERIVEGKVTYSKGVTT